MAVTPVAMAGRPFRGVYDNPNYDLVQNNSIIDKGGQYENI